MTYRLTPKEVARLEFALKHNAFMGVMTGRYRPGMPLAVDGLTIEETACYWQLRALAEFLPAVSAKSSAK
jgi:hypothetical protein